MANSGQRKGEAIHLQLLQQIPFNVSLMNLSFSNQGDINSPSYLRGGAARAAGALMLFKIIIRAQIILLRRFAPPPLF